MRSFGVNWPSPRHSALSGSFELNTDKLRDFHLRRNGITYKERERERSKEGLLSGSVATGRDDLALSPSGYKVLTNKSSIISPPPTV